MGTGLDLIKKPYRFLRSIPVHLMGTVTHVATQEPVAALTFDDGPDPFFTPRLLEILNKYNAKATFFMVGKCAEKYPELVREVAKSGHAIGVHSWDHPSFPSITGRKRRKQIRDTEKTIAPYGKKLFRPPYGHQTAASRFDTLLLGYEVIAWNVHASDWKKHDSQWMADKLAKDLSPGSIILLHDKLYEVLVEGAADRSPMLEALDLFLGGTGRRYRFISVPDLLGYGKVKKSSWYVRGHDDWK